MKYNNLLINALNVDISLERICVNNANYQIPLEMKENQYITANIVIIALLDQNNLVSIALNVIIVLMFSSLINMNVAQQPNNAVYALEI